MENSSVGGLHHATTNRQRGIPILSLAVFATLVGCFLVIFGVFTTAIHGFGPRVGLYFDIQHSHAELLLLWICCGAIFLFMLQRVAAIALAVPCSLLLIHDRNAAALQADHLKSFRGMGLLQLLNSMASGLGLAWTIMGVGVVTICLVALLYRPEAAEAASAGMRRDIAGLVGLLAMAALVFEFIRTKETTFAFGLVPLVLALSWLLARRPVADGVRAPWSRIPFPVGARESFVPPDR